MRNFLAIACLFLYGLACLAQSPQKFSFQGVARGSDGKTVNNAVVGIRISIRSSTMDGEVVYQETHAPLTSPDGVFSISIGEGTVIVGNLGAIPWKKHAHFLQLELDVAGGTSYVDLGTTQLLSVPYALHSAQAGKWSDGYPVIQKNDVLGIGDPDIANQVLPTVGAGSRLIWYPQKGAFRAGMVGNGAWEDAQIGNPSAAFGMNTLASGESSTAFGTGSVSTTTNSFATGYGTNASGWASATFGSHTTAKANGSFSAGFYNDNRDSPHMALLDPSDRIFQIGNGDDNARKNAVTILRNGNIGFGNIALNPTHILDVGGRVRVRHKDFTAGIYFDNSQHQVDGFVGMKTDTQIGFYLGNSWMFWVDKGGTGYINNAIVQTSDRRLKRDFSPLSSSLRKLTGLNGYHYYWKDKERDASLQTGMIAQEVEALFPELVKTDSNGFKSLNYTGLIPHLIEAVKVLAAQNQTLETENARSRNENRAIQLKLAEIAARLDQLAVPPAGANAK